MKRRIAVLYNSRIKKFIIDYDSNVTPHDRVEAIYDDLKQAIDDYPQAIISVAERKANYEKRYET